MDQFWAQVIASLVGALAGGLISALVAWRVFAGERQARALDRSRDADDARKERFRKCLETLYATFNDMISALPLDSGLNAPSFAAMASSTRSMALTLELDETDREHYEGWVNAFTVRYIKKASDARSATGELRELGTFIELASQRLEYWFRGKTPAAEFSLSDAEFTRLHPETLKKTSHPDSS